MTQIINLITFLKELFFGSDRNERRKGRHSFRNLLFTAVLAASIVINYWAIQGIYQSTAKVVKLKVQVQELKPMVDRMQELERTNEILTYMLSTLAPGHLAAVMGKPGTPGPLPSKEKSAVLPLNLPPRHVVTKEDPLQGKTPPKGN